LIDRSGASKFPVPSETISGSPGPSLLHIGGTLPRLRVVAVDDHPLYLFALEHMLRSRREFDVVATCADGRAALSQIQEHEPDLGLVDFGLPLLDGIQVAAAVTRRRLRTRIVMLSAFEEGVTVYRAIEAGASAYLSKRACVDEIVDTLGRVAAGEVVIAPLLGCGLAEEIRRRGGSQAPRLTDREEQVLSLLCDGCSAPEVARRLYLGLTTVKTHLASIYSKLDVSDRAAAVAAAMRQGLIE